MGTPRLRITDGLTFFDLLIDNADAGNSGLGVSEFKDDGYERNDPLAEGRQPIAFVRDDIFETYRINITASSEDLLYKRENELISLLEKGIRYWQIASEQHFDNSAVYIEEKGGDETNITYSILKKYKIISRSQLYDSTQTMNLSLSFQLVIMHGQRRGDLLNQTTQIQVDGLHDIVKEISLPISSTSDVLSVYKRSASTTASPPYIGHAGEPMKAAIRFTSVPINNSSIIYDAKLIVVAGGASSSLVFVRQVLHDSDNSPAFSTGAELLSRQETSASKLWDVPLFSGINAEYESESMRNQLQEVINRSDWTINNAITCFLDDNLSANNANSPLRISVSNPHKLNVVWSEGESIGQLATISDRVHFSNKYASANITHVFTYDGISFSSNLFGSSLPQTLPVDTTSKEIYFGISATNNGILSPFSSLVFDITKLTANGDVSMDWQYYDGVSFTSLATSLGFLIRDNTGNMNNPGDTFTNDGVNACVFKPPSDFTTTTINGVTGYWIKLDVTAASVTSNPIQNNQQIYTVARPFVNTTTVTGSIDSLYRLLIESESSERDNANSSMYSDRFVIGVKKLEGRELFTGFINCTNSQNGVGINVTLLSDTTETSDTTSANGLVALHTSTNKFLETRVQIKIQETAIPNYYGSYNVYIRAKADAALAFISFSYSVGEQEDEIERDGVEMTSTSAYELLYLGQMTINFPSAKDANPQELLINIKTLNKQTPPSNIYLYDVILMPNDIWIGDFKNKDTSNTVGSLNYKKILDIDSSSSRGEDIIASVLNNNNEVVSSWEISASKLKLAPSTRYRFLFLSAKAGASGEWISEPWVVHSAKIFATSRYLTRRGNE